jgi:glutamine synthetase
VFTAIEAGKVEPSKPGSFLGLGTPVLPSLPLHGGDRNRTSPFAFTGNKFEFRALGSSMSLALPNTVLNTIVAEAIDELAGKLQTALKASGANLEKAVTKVVKESYAANKRVVFGGDNYSDAWHKEAEKRGLYNLRSTPEALPWLVEKQYTTKLNIEAETAAALARTLILPAAVRHLNVLKASELEELTQEIEPVIKEFHFALRALEDVNLAENQPDSSPQKWAAYMHDRVVPAMDDVREVADRLEKLVADDLWPLPKYSEMLFIK